ARSRQPSLILSLVRRLPHVLSLKSTPQESLSSPGHRRKARMLPRVRLSECFLHCCNRLFCLVRALVGYPAAERDPFLRSFPWGPRSTTISICNTLHWHRLDYPHRFSHDLHKETPHVSTGCVVGLPPNQTMQLTPTRTAFTFHHD